MDHFQFQLVIPTHQRTGHLTLLLDSIVDLAQPELVHSVWVVENGSAVARELTESYKSRLPIYYRHLNEGNKSKALNLVLPELRTGYPTLNLDDDVIVPTNLLRYYAEAIKEFGQGHYFGGPTTVRYEVKPNPKLVRWMPASNRGLQLPHDKPTKVGRQDFLGCNWVCFPEDLIALGGYNSNYGPSAIGGARGQETDMQYRLANAGITAVYVPGEQVSHWVPKNHITSEWVLDRLERSAIYRGFTEGNFLYELYWSIMVLKCQLLKPMNSDYRFRLRKYKGYIKGSRRRKY